MVMGLGGVPQLEVDQACEEREAALDCKLKDWERKLVARNASWPDNPRSAARRAAQDLVLQMVDSNQNDIHSFTLYLSIVLYCVLLSLQH